VVTIPLTDVPPVDDVPPLSISDSAETLVLIRYSVEPANRAAFVTQMQVVRHSRRRTGATRWALYDDREDAHVVIEAFAVGSWREHLSQHEDRMTGFDQVELERARALAKGEPHVRHLTEIDPAAPAEPGS